MSYGMDYQGGGGFGGGSSGGGGGGGGSGYSQGGGDSGRGKRLSYDEQTVLPVTILMALQSQGDGQGAGDLQLVDGRKLHHIRIVAAVRSAEPTSTSVLYTMEDGTGLIEVKQWLDDNESSSAARDLRDRTMKDHIYLKITGQIKDYDGKKMLVANSVRPLTTANELTHHMIEVAYAEQKFRSRNAMVAPVAPPMGNGVGFGGPMSTPTSNRPLQAASGGGGARDEVQQFFTMAANSAVDASIGTSIDDCIKTFAGRFSDSEIRRVINDLSSEGLIYSTTDEEHYATAF